MPPSTTSTPESELIDERDGQAYPIRKIGEQYWMADNLRFATPQSYCYNNDPGACKNSGRFYTFKEALEACPKGWRLPTDADWKALEAALGMSKAEQEAFRVWRGKAEGQQLKELFGVVFPGMAEAGGREFQARGVIARYWTATAGPSGEQFAIYRQLMQSEERIYSDQIPRKKLCCIRCLKN